MLFGPCTDASAPFLSGVSQLCSGGAGFVSAVMATLAAGAKTAPAKTLRGDVPVVDKLAVRMVTDNIVIQFVPNETSSSASAGRLSASAAVPAAIAHFRNRMLRMSCALRFVFMEVVRYPPRGLLVVSPVFEYEFKASPRCRGVSKIRPSASHQAFQSQEP